MAAHREAEPNDVFVEEAPHEQGFARVFAADVAPHMPQLRRRLRNRQSDRVAMRRILGVVLLIAIWSIYAFWGAGTFDLVLAAGLSGLILDLLLRSGVTNDNDPVRKVPGLIAIALKNHVEGLEYKPFAGRRVNYDRFVTIAEIRGTPNIATGPFFAGERHGMAFRAVLCTARHPADQLVFHGLLIEIDTGTAPDEPVVILRRDRDTWIDHAMPEVEVPGHPAFRALFMVHCAHDDVARAFLSEQTMTALARLPEQTGDGLLSILAEKGQLLLEVRLPPQTDDPLASLDAVTEAREQLRTVMLPYRMIDTLNGIDPDTGGRYRSR